MEKLTIELERNQDGEVEAVVVLDNNATNRYLPEIWHRVKLILYPVGRSSYGYAECSCGWSHGRSHGECDNLALIHHRVIIHLQAAGVVSLWKDGEPPKVEGGPWPNTEPEPEPKPEPAPEHVIQTGETPYLNGSMYWARCSCGAWFDRIWNTEWARGPVSTGKRERDAWVEEHKKLNQKPEPKPVNHVVVTTVPGMTAMCTCGWVSGTASPPVTVSALIVDHLKEVGVIR
jgi:hypothetical protein